MKWAFAVALLLMSFASMAMADGSGLPPVIKKPPAPATIQLADGSGLPPGTPRKPTKPQADMAV
jgi:hypothetical protein